MIVLDENTIQESIVAAIARWYPGRVCIVSELRPHTVIKDEAIPTLLTHERQPTFVTTNAADFWQKASADRRYCIICLPLPNERQHEIPVFLRRLVRVPAFGTKANRMGKVVRVTPSGVQFYQADGAAVQFLPWETKPHGLRMA